MGIGRDRSGKGRGGATSGVIAVEINGERLVIDNRAMTIRERQLVRHELAAITNPDRMDWIAGAVWIARRRTDPTVTYDDVCEALTIGDIDDVELVEPESDSPEV